MKPRLSKQAGYWAYTIVTDGYFASYMGLTPQLAYELWKERNAKAA